MVLNKPLRYASIKTGKVVTAIRKTGEKVLINNIVYMDLDSFLKMYKKLGELK